MGEKISKDFFSRNFENWIFCCVHYIRYWMISSVGPKFLLLLCFSKTRPRLSWGRVAKTHRISDVWQLSNCNRNLLPRGQNFGGSFWICHIHSNLYKVSYKNLLLFCMMLTKNYILFCDIKFLLLVFPWNFTDFKVLSYTEIMFPYEFYQKILLWYVRIQSFSDQISKIIYFISFWITLFKS